MTTETEIKKLREATKKLGEQLDIPVLFIDARTKKKEVFDKECAELRSDLKEFRESLTNLSGGEK
jgi:glutamate formiminotransferase